jgi:hypothetical protein
MRSLVRRFGYVVAASALLLSFAGARQASAAPVMALADCQGKPQVRPSAILFACGDGNFSAKGLAWSGWGKSTTTATGSAESNDCTPNCAAGHFHSYPIRVIVSGRASCPGGRPAYSTVTFAWPSKNNPGGKPYPMQFPCTSR